MQLVQQSASNFDKLDPAIQRELISLASTMDAHAYEIANRQLEGRDKFRHRRLDDTGVARKQILTSLSVLAVLGLLSGTGITVAFIWKDQFQLGKDVMFQGLGIISALLGGAGISSLLRRNTGMQSSDSDSDDD